MAMIDLANLLPGGILGFVLGLIPWAVDRYDGRKQRLEQVRDDWAVASKAIELSTWKTDTTAADLYVLRVQFPVDRWRLVLGSADFLLLERLEVAYQVHEGTPSAATSEKLNRARTEFANMARAAQSAGYDEVVKKDERQRIRRDYLHYPLRTWKRERQSRIVRRQATPIAPAVDS